MTSSISQLQSLQQQNASTGPLRVAFLHPDLGIGGAERLVVDAAIALRNYGHIVHIFTSHHANDHCFEETDQRKPNALPVWVVGDFLPTKIFGRFAIICAMLRGIWLSLWLLWNWTLYNPLIRRNRVTPQSTANEKLVGGYDVVITDQLSIYNVLLTFTSARTIFYCHFPDLLLSKPEKSSFLQTIKSIYRFPINFLEQLSTGMSEMVLVNSNFTSQIFAQTFSLLHYRNVIPTVLYPSIAMDSYDSNEEYDTYVKSWWKWYYQKELLKEEKNDDVKKDHLGEEPKSIINYKPSDDFAAIEDIPQTTALFVSINRFEHKKDVAQAIYAFVYLQDKLKNDKNVEKIIQENKKETLNDVKNGKNPTFFSFLDTKLIIAGGYDPLVNENVMYYEQLDNIASDLSLKTSLYPDTTGDIIFLRSFSNQQRASLLRRSHAVLYTPENEHFGIVPVEAMYSSRPVIAHISGGPLESVIHEKTGYLCQKHPVPTEFIEKYSILPTTIKTSQSDKYANSPLFGDALVSIYTSKNNIDITKNNFSHKHAIDRFGFESFSRQWETSVRNVMALNTSNQLWIRNFLDNFGHSPRSKFVMFFNMTITMFLVMIWARIRPFSHGLGTLIEKNILGNPYDNIVNNIESTGSTTSSTSESIFEAISQ